MWNIWWFIVKNSALSKKRFQVCPCRPGGNLYYNWQEGLFRAGVVTSERLIMWFRVGFEFYGICWPGVWFQPLWQSIIQNSVIMIQWKFWTLKTKWAFNALLLHIDTGRANFTGEDSIRNLPRSTLSLFLCLVFF